MTVCLLVMTDGRHDCLERTLESAYANLHGDIGVRVIHNDSPDPVFRDWLSRRYAADFTIIHTPSRSGFGGAIRNAWSHLRDSPEPFEYVAHVEDDFTFNRPVDLTAMSDVLDAHPYLMQMALRRQPWNDRERAAGGVVEQYPTDYAEETDGQHQWLEHRLFFTTNPCLYRRQLLEDYEWPTGVDSEATFGRNLRQDPAVRFGYWGARDSGEAVLHIGNERVGILY